MRLSSPCGFVFAAFVLLLMAGCQTTRPTNIIQRAPADIEAATETWNPRVCILCRTVPGEEKRSKLQKHLLKAAQTAGVDYYSERNTVPQGIDVLLDITDIGEPSLFVSPRATYSNAEVHCKIECLDARDDILGTRNIAGSAHAAENAAAVGASILFMLPTMNLSSKVEHSAMKNTALAAAFRDLAARIVNLAGDPILAKQILLEHTRSMDAVDLTNLGVDAFVKEDYGKAGFYLAETVRRFPSYQPALCYLGASQARLGHDAEAETTLEQAVQLAPDTLEAAQAQQWIQYLNN